MSSIMVRLGIESISHAFLDVKHLPGNVQCQPGEFGCSQACEIDVNCRDGDDWQLDKKIGSRIYTTREVLHRCTGK